MKCSSREDSWFCSIFTYLSELVTFAAHLVLYLYLWARIWSSDLYNKISNFFSVAVYLSCILNEVTYTQTTLMICTEIFQWFFFYLYLVSLWFSVTLAILKEHIHSLTQVFTLKDFAAPFAQNFYFLKSEWFLTMR